MSNPDTQSEVVAPVATAPARDGSHDGKQSAPTRSWWWALAVVFVVALSLRGVYLWQLQGSVLLEFLLLDAEVYDAWAQRIAAGDWIGNEVFYQSPLYPYFLAVIYRLAGHNLEILRAVQIAIGAGSCVLLMSAGRSLFSARVGFLAGLLLAIYPPAIYFDVLVQKPVLDLFLTTLLLALMGRLQWRPSGWSWFVAGAALGLLMLNRENARMLAPVLLAWLVLYFRGFAWTARLTWCALAVAGMAVVLLPVGARNFYVGREFLISTSQLGPNFYIGNHAGATGEYVPLRPRRGDPTFERLDATELAEAEVRRRLSPREVSNYWLAKSAKFIRRHPLEWCRLMAKKWMLVWNSVERVDAESIEVYKQHSAILRTLGWVLHFGVICPLAAIGMWATRYRWRELAVLYAILLSMALSVAIFYVFARYRFPLVPLLVLFAAAGIDQVAAWLRHPRSIRPLDAIPAIVLCAAAAVGANWPLAGHNSDEITYFNLGSALLGQDRFAEAVPLLRQVVTANPTFVEAHGHLGIALLGSGDAQAAVDELDRARQLDPSYKEARIMLGIALFQTGDRARATPYLEEAVKGDARMSQAFSMLGLIRLERGRLEESAKLLSTAVRMNPSDGNAEYWLGAVELRLGNPTAAIPHFHRALKLRANFVQASGDLAAALAATGDSTTAVAVLRSGVDRSNRDAGLLNNLAWILATDADPSVRKGGEAVTLAEELARTSRFANPYYLDTLAASYAEAGRYADAVRTAKNAIGAARAADDQQLATDVERRLAEYEAGRAWRE